MYLESILLMKKIRNGDFFDWKRQRAKISHLQKEIGSSPNPTPGRLWAKLDLKLGPGLKRDQDFVSLGLSFPLSWDIGFIIPNLRPTSSPGNINPEALCQHLSKLRGNSSLNLLFPVFGPTESPTHSQTYPWPGMSCFIVGQCRLVCLFLKGKRFMIGVREEKFLCKRINELNYRNKEK